MDVLIEKIRTRLRSCPKRRLHHPVRGQAAVLMPLFLEKRRPHLLLTRRSETVATHKGQVSFPGGVRDDEDESLRETALRETREEIGIEPQRVEILGDFHEYRSITDLQVTPFVGYLQAGFTLRPNPEEVDHVLEVPLGFFLETEPRRQGYTSFGEERTLYSWEYRGERIWGLTAAMIHDLCDLL